MNSNLRKRRRAERQSRHHGTAARRSFAQAAQAALDNADKTPLDDGRYRAGLFLSELSRGDCGDVRALVGSPVNKLRLLEMGLTAGTHVKVLRIAAFGGPFDILLRGYQLSLRRDEAAAVWIGDEGDLPPAT